MIEESGGERNAIDQDFLIQQLKDDAQAAYEAREEELGAEAVRELERQVLLAVIDRKWREHLYEMDYLQEGISLRAYAQRDPVVEYQREGFDMFNQMMEGIKEEAVGFLFNLEVQVEEQPTVKVDPSQAVPLPGASTTESEQQVEVRAKGLGGRAPPGEPAVHRPDHRRRGGRRLPGHPAAGGPGPGYRRRRLPGPGRPGPLQREPPQRQRREPPARPGGVERPVAQRAVLLRLGQEVQALPRRPGRSRLGLTTGPSRRPAHRLSSRRAGRLLPRRAAPRCRAPWRIEARPPRVGARDAHRSGTRQAPRGFRGA